VNVCALLGATLTARSTRGSREMPIAEFAAGYMTTALEPDEMLSAISLPLPSAGDGSAFEEFARRHGDFAIVACSALVRIDAKGAIERASVSISGLSHAPVRPRKIEDALRGERPSHETYRNAAMEAQKLEAAEDAYVTAAYRQHLARVLTYRALEKAAGRAMEPERA
jgi:carbon-monoxide dehydrogenase medium subunit